MSIDKVHWGQEDLNLETMLEEFMDIREIANKRYINTMRPSSYFMHGSTVLAVHVWEDTSKKEIARF